MLRRGIPRAVVLAGLASVESSIWTLPRPILVAILSAGVSLAGFVLRFNIRIDITVIEKEATQIRRLLEGLALH